MYFITCKHPADSIHGLNTTKGNRYQGKHCPVPTRFHEGFCFVVSIADGSLGIC